jgi:hypothetical protein
LGLYPIPYSDLTVVTEYEVTQISFGGQRSFSNTISVDGADFVNTFLAQYARRHYNFPGATGQPNLDIDNDLMFGHSFGVNDAMYESRLQFPMRRPQ